MALPCAADGHWRVLVDTMCTIFGQSGLYSALGTLAYCCNTSINGHAP